MSHRIRLLPQVGSRWFSLALLAATVLMVLAVLAGAAGTAVAGSPSEQRKFKSQFQGKFDTPAPRVGRFSPGRRGIRRDDRRRSQVRVLVLHCGQLGQRRSTGAGRRWLYL